MKTIKNILWVLIGVVISCGCSVFAVSRYFANQVQYTSQKSLLAVNNVGDALDELYAQTTFGNPTGTILTYMGNNAPSGYLKCDGTVYNISEYGNLANQIKTEFGSYNYFGGDGTTTFAVPDLRGEFLRGTGTDGQAGQGNGANVGEHTNEGLPNITGSFRILANGAVGSNMSVPSASGAFYSKVLPGWRDGYTDGNNGNPTYYAEFNASRSSSIYGNSNHVTPTNTSVLYVIKY